MKVLLVHNRYGRPSGEETVVDATVDLLRSRGDTAETFFRSSRELNGSFPAAAHAFFSGIYSPRSRREIRATLERLRPDVVHIHNLFPLISPSILPECRRTTPVVMTVHNHRLVCPNALLAVRGEICNRCLGGREWWCFLRNCEDSLPKSLGYALRSTISRRCRWILDNVTAYAVLTHFQRRELVEAGFPGERIAIVPNHADLRRLAPSPDLGDAVGYVGRVSPEKGVTTFLEVARLLPGIPFRAAGPLDRMPHLAAQAPANVEFVGMVDAAAMGEFYRRCRIVVLPSLCQEAFGLPLAEAGACGKPVVASRIGGLPEVVDDGVTGLLAEPGNAEDFAAKLRRLWDDPDLRRRMGRAGREKVLREYSPDRYYERLTDLYRRAMAWGPGAPRAPMRTGTDRA